MVPNLGIFPFFFFYEMLYLDKFEGADFKYDNSFCSNSSPKAPKQFWGFLQNFVIRQIRRGLFQIWQYFFLIKIKIYELKTQFSEIREWSFQIWQFWSFIQKSFFCKKYYTFWQTEGAEVKQDKSFFKF